MASRPLSCKRTNLGANLGVTKKGVGASGRILTKSAFVALDVNASLTSHLFDEILGPVALREKKASQRGEIDLKRYFRP